MFELILWTLLFFICLFILIKATDWFVLSANNLGLILNLPKIVIGILFIGLGTIIPLLSVSVFSTAINFSEIGTSAVFGSLIINLLFLIVAIGLIKKKQDIFLRFNIDLLFLTISTFLFIFFIIDFKFSVVEGIVSLILMLLYSYYLYISKPKENQDEIPEKETTVANFIVFVVCFIAVYFSTSYLIKSTINISELLMINKAILAITLLAIGTSLPLFLLALSAIKRDEIDLIVGVVIGNNILVTLGIFGMSVFFGSLVISENLFYIIPFYLISTILFAITVNFKKINWLHAVFAIIIYLAFMFGLAYL